MYIKAGLPAKAARIAISHPDITSQVDLVERIAKQLLKGGLHERVHHAFPYLYTVCFSRVFCLIENAAMLSMNEILPVIKDACYPLVKVRSCLAPLDLFFKCCTL